MQDFCKELNKSIEGDKSQWEVNYDISVIGIPFDLQDYDRSSKAINKNTTDEEVKKLQHSQKIQRKRGGMLSQSYYCRFCDTVCSAVWKLKQHWNRTHHKQKVEQQGKSKQRRTVGHTKGQISCKVCISKTSGKKNKQLDKLMNKVQDDYRKVLQQKLEIEKRKATSFAILQSKKILDTAQNKWNSRHYYTHLKYAHTPKEWLNNGVDFFKLERSLTGDECRETTIWLKEKGYIRKKQ